MGGLDLSALDTSDEDDLAVDSQRKSEADLLRELDSSDADDPAISLAATDAKTAPAPPSSSRAQSKISEMVPQSFDLLRPSSLGTMPVMLHELDAENLKTFVYPVDMEVRDYQRNIIRKALTQNIICALPTGLGKTFIATVVMLNWFRWTKSAKIVFIAPTRPLVAQQVQSFLEISGVSIRETAALLQSVVDRKQRAAEWASKRIFFATAQTVENDIREGIADPASFVLLVLDEAHRATGNHSYLNVVKMVQRVNQSFRILALTATPSGRLDGVQLIIDNLAIAATEIRSEESLDIRKYVHGRDMDKVRVDYSREQQDLLKLLSKATERQMKLLRSAKIVLIPDIAQVHNFMLLAEMKRYMVSDAARVNQGRKFQIQAVGALMSKIAYAVMLLKNHGVVPFYHRMHQLELELMGSKGRNARELLSTSEFRAVLSTSRRLIYGEDKGPTYSYASTDRRLGFYGHPKLEVLVNKVESFLRSHGADSRIIVFAEFRDSAAEIQWMLNTFNAETVRSNLFVGQATSNKKDGVKGMNQKEQQAVLSKFKSGEFNVLIATSIGEEGLDIGQVDLIVCYDQSQSPIRNIQRMGRTGRKRSGNVIMLMTEKEEAKLAFAFGGHRYIRDRIYDSSGRVKNGSPELRLRYAPANRLIPYEAEPKYTEIHIDVPPENQAALASGDVIAAMKDAAKKARTRQSSQGRGRKRAPHSAQSNEDQASSGASLDQFGFQIASEAFPQS